MGEVRIPRRTAARAHFVVINKGAGQFFLSSFFLFEKKIQQAKIFTIPDRAVFPAVWPLPYLTHAHSPTVAAIHSCFSLNGWAIAKLFSDLDNPRDCLDFRASRNKNLKLD